MGVWVARSNAALPSKLAIYIPTYEYCLYEVVLFVFTFCFVLRLYWLVCASARTTVQLSVVMETTALLLQWLCTANLCNLATAPQGSCYLGYGQVVFTTV